MDKILIVGVGSILRGDDGIGVRVLDELEKLDLPQDVKLYSGDISGLDLLKIFPGFDKVIIVDAADMHEEAGTIKVLDGAKIKKADFKDQFSTHGMALLETLTLAEKLEMDCDITIVGVQPEFTGFSLELSEKISFKIPEVVDTVRSLIL